MPFANSLPLLRKPLLYNLATAASRRDCEWDEPSFGGQPAQGGDLAS
ncbi:hypothetical protein OAK65_00140 [Synechococcus sp. AH-551-N17]|nr:hypothetical protein [Synechococcus sp. AH-551-N17]